MSEMPEQQLQHHLDVGTEVSAKYRGAFCEARIKSVKKLVIFHVKSVSKHQPKSCGLTEDCVKGKLKVGSYVEARFPEQTAWTEGYITNIKDKSTYTVEFDDGDIRSLPRNFLCLQGVRHYPESDTLDHLPLTDPENFGTPVLSTKRKPKRKQTSFGKSFFTNADSDDQRSIPPSPKRKSTTTSKNTSNEEVEEEDEQETAESKEATRERWLDDKMLGKLIFAVNGKKKFPAVVVNPMIRSDFASVAEGQVMVRSFINGKFSIVQRSTVLTKANIPTSGGKVTDSQSREAAKDAFIWESSGKPPECWRTEVVTSLVPDDVSDDEDDDVCGDDDDTSSKSSASKEEEDEDKEEKKLKNQLFLEQLYKFMEDIGTPITKTPVLGYKDLDLYMLYNLVQTRGGSHAMTKSVEWREVYSGLKIPKHNSAGSHHVKQAFNKYLLRFEEYLISFKNTPFNQQIKKATETAVVPTTPKKSTTTTTIDNIDNSSVDSSSSTTSSLVRRTSRRRKASESAIPDIDNIDTKDTKPTIRKSKGGGANDGDDSSGSKSSTGSKTEGKAKLMKKRRASLASSTSSSSSQTKKPKYNINDILLIRYKVETDDSYEAKVTKIAGGGDDERYFVHYPGWNTRFDEWVEVNRIVGYAREGGSGGEPNKANRRPRPNFDNAGDSPTVVKEEAVETTTPTTTPKPVKKENQKSSSSSSSVVGTECTKKSTTPSRQRRGSTSSAPMAQIEYIGKEGADSLEKRAASEEKTLNVAAGRIKGKNLKRPPSVISEIEEKKTSVNPTPVLKIEPPDDPTPVVAIPVPGRRTSGRPSIPPSYHQDSVRFPIKRRPRGARVTTSGTTTTTKSTVPCTSIDLPKKSSITPTVRDPTSTATTTTTMTNIKPFPTSSSSSSAATNVVEDTKPILPLSTTTTPQCGATTSTGSGQRFKRRSPPPTAVVQPTPVQSTSMFGTISDILASELADLQGAKNNSPQQQEEELSCQEGEEEPHRVEPGASEEEEAVSSNIYDFTSSSPSPSPAQAPPPPSQPPTTLSQTSIVTSQKTDDDDDMDDMMDDIDDMMNSSVGSSLSSQQDDDEEETPNNSCSTNNKDSTTTTITITPPDEATKVLLPVTSTSTLYAAVVTSSSSCTETSPSSSPSTTTTNNPPTTTTTTTTEVTTPDDVEMREVESSGDANNNGNSTSTSSSNEAHSNFSSPDQKEEDDEENNKTQNNHNNSSSPNKQSNSNDNNKHDNQKQKKNTKGVKRKRQSNHQQEKDNGGNSESGGEDNNKSASRRKRRSNKKKKTANVTDKTSAVPPVPNIPPEDELQKLSPDEIISRLSDQKMCLRKVWQQCRLEVQRLDRKRKRYKRLQEEENASDNKKLFSPTKRDNSVVDCAA